MTLGELLEAAASSLDGVMIASPAGGVTWSRGAIAFATLSADGTSAEFRLDAAVASAAVRTPDTVPSTRGAGWVLFRPARLDEHAADRAAAWLGSAYRHAAAR